ncbi:MAG: ABC transporter permease [Vicinamibacterales bacterium]
MSGTRPSRLEALLRAAIGDGLTARVVLGDLHEEYAGRRDGALRRTAFVFACLRIAARYAPGRIADVVAVDLRHARRAIRRSPGFAAATGATLALAIGASATVLTIAYGSLLAPLPVADPDRLIRWGQTPIGGTSVNSAAVANLLDLEARTTLVEGMAAEMARRVNVSAEASTDGWLAASVTWNYFDVLGVAPTLGRRFVEADDRPGAPDVAIVGERLWRRALAAAPDAVGREIRIDGRPYRVLGVMPADLALPGDPQVWTPFRWDAAARAERRRRMIEPIARLKPGVAMAAALGEMRAVFASLAVEHPEANGTTTVAVMPWADWLLGRRGPTRALLPLLAAAAALLLGIALLNVTGLALARAEGRRQEQALQRLLGASPVRQFSRRALEAALIATPAAAAGALIAGWSVPLVLARYGDAIPRAAAITAGPVTTAVAVAAGLVATLLLAVVGGAFARTGGGLAGLDRRSSARPLRLRRRLVIAQMGLACGLVYGALLLGGTMVALARVDLGVPLDDTLTFAITLPRDRAAAAPRFVADLQSAIRTLPGVRQVGATSRTPFAGGTNGEVSSADDPARVEAIAEYRAVTPGLFPALGLTLEEGRVFDGPISTGPPDAMLSASLAAELFPDRSAVGRRVRLGGDETWTVTGVVGDLRDFGPTRPSRPTIYLRHGAAPGFASTTSLVFVVRADRQPLGLLPAIRDRLRELDRDVALERPATLATLAARSIGTSRTTAATLLVAFASVALGLGAIGLFGVLAFSVARRTREWGVRLALGETPRGLLVLVLREGFGLLAGGLVVGIAAAWLLDRLVAGLLPASGVAPPVAMALAALLLLAAVTLAAGLAPARRAARLSPVEALKAE